MVVILVITLNRDSLGPLITITQDLLSYLLIYSLNRSFNYKRPLPL